MFLRCCLRIVVTGKVNQEQILHPKGTFWLFKAVFDVSTTHLSDNDPNFYLIYPKGWRVVPARQTGQNQEYFGYNPRYRNIASKLSLNLSSIINFGIQGDPWRILREPFFLSNEPFLFLSVLIWKS